MGYQKQTLTNYAVNLFDLINFTPRAVLDIVRGRNTCEITRSRLFKAVWVFTS